MDKLRVAIYVEESILPSEGGGFSYYQRMVKEIDRYSFPEDIEIVYLLPGSGNMSYPFAKPVIENKPGTLARAGFWFLENTYKLVHKLSKDGAQHLLEALSRQISRIKNYTAERSLMSNNIDLVYYLKPNDYPMNYPMIATHWDVGHKSMYPFPEVAANGNYKKRELYYASMLSKAFVILCESNAGAEELMHYYPVNRDRVKVLPLFGGEILSVNIEERKQDEILRALNLETGKFFVYPAQFWAHKNHFNLVQAFAALLREDKYKDLKLVLCGADQGNMPYIRQLIASLQIEESVRVTGFVSNEKLFAFYKHAIALVMPTFLGPTNIPLIEAAMLNCVVLCSDFKGHREMLGDSALYFNPANASEITLAMKDVLNTEVRLSMRIKASERMVDSEFQISGSLVALKTILQEIRPVRKAWGRITNLLQVFTYANIGMENF